MESAVQKQHEALAIEAEGLVRRFGTVEALAGVSLQIPHGEFFSLLGPSGCGKTTLLRLIAGLDVPDSGSLKIGGSDAAGIPAHRRPVNTVFQSYALFPHLTVWQNIAFGLRMNKVPPTELRARVERVMELVEVRDLAPRLPAQLSGGQKQRVALARALVNEPQVLLLDEPLGALDLKLRKQLQVELHQLQRRLGITFVYVTHDQEEALALSHRIAVMNRGRIEQLDFAEALYERPRTRFVAQFLGSCNLFPATVRLVQGNRVELDSVLGVLQTVLRDGCPSAQPGRSVTVSLRPEKLRIHPKASEPPGPNAIPAVIEDLVYSGSETQYLLRADGCRLKAVALNSRVGHQGLGLNQSVLCTFVEDALVLLQD